MVHSNRNPRANLGKKRLKGEGTAFGLSGTSGGARRNAPSDLTQEAGAGKPNRSFRSPDGGGRNKPNKFGLGFPTRGRQPQRPTNPHDPRSKDPFMRAGIGLGTNDTKIFTRAGMSMDLKKMRKMF